MDRKMLYEILYALAARDGREEALFGKSAPLAREAFARSLAGDYFPELWFEVPLSGSPWFDLHALVSHDDLSPEASFEPETCGGNPAAFAWFASQRSGVRQLSLSWDVGKGDAEHPAVQLLVSNANTELTCGFLDAVGRPDAASAYRAFAERLPKGWFACYAGAFPQRPELNLRVECIPDSELQRAYADDASLLEAHLRQVGLDDLGQTLLPRCQALARTPFSFELQFDVMPDGSAGSTLGASVRFACPPGEGKWAAFEADGAAGELMSLIEEWGLADKRWRLLSDTAFAKRASFGGKSCVLYSFPAFVKLRWRAGEPLDAKAYLIAGVQQG